MENRTYERYRLSARAVFSWEGPQQKRVEGEGVSRDISLAGAFILTRSCPPTDTTVQVELFLPPIHGTVATARMRAQALVLRVEYGPPGEQQSGFAVKSAGFTLPSEVEPDSESGSGLTSD
jgi:PilZ domain-containing protein